jgi:hypothetical protein
VTVFKEYTTEEQLSVVRFSWARGLNLKDIQKEMFCIYCGKCLSCKTVETLFQGCSKVADDTRLGRPMEIATETILQRVEEMIHADRRITIDSVATALVCSHGLAYSIMHDHLKFRKVCARWVPRQLKDRENMNGRALSLQHFLRYADEGEDVFNRTVTGDDSWVHHYQPESKHSSMQWKHPSSASTKKFKLRH